MRHCVFCDQDIEDAEEAEPVFGGALVCLRCVHTLAQRIRTAFTAEERKARK